MDTLFMRAFERQDEAEARMRQQAASYSRTLACSLLAAGHQPPPWLHAHHAPFETVFHRGAAEEMRLQVEAYSQSTACAVVDAGHLPPPWLLPHRATAGGDTSERSVPADALMRKQVVSYSLSIAYALLAAGHCPPPWLLQSPADLATEETAGKSYIREPDQNVHIRANQNIKNLKEVHSLSITNAGKITHSLHGRLSKTETSCSKCERNRRGTNLKKGCRPWNTVSKLTSIIPLAKQNQQASKSCVAAKRDVRVRALKVAAAAKRREEKKQTEREMHKAAVKLALERLKQEKEHRQKQVDHKKKTKADFITRKGQREGYGKRENDIKKKCAEETPKHQKQLPEIMHSINTVKDTCPNDTDGKDLVENLVERVGNQLLSDERMKSIQKLFASESNSVKAMHADLKSTGSGLQVQENLSDNVDKSYGMTPYEDSDAKDFEILEHQREVTRRCKLIPSWAQEENLDKILVSNLALDSREVFAHKCSGILSDVLTPGIPRRPFY